MMRMRNIVAMLTAVVAGLALTSCGTTYSLSVGHAAYADDLYEVHDRAALAAAEAEIAAAEAAAREANEKRIAAMVAASKAEDDIDAILESVDLGGYYVDTSAASGGGNVSIYNNIYVDDYSSAYARRLQGFSSLTYRMPSSYYDYRYGDAYFLTLAYDPAFYTVMVMGDQVWVEPRYITNMFGSWSNPYYYNYRYGYNPYYYGYSYGYYDPWGWNSPYWGCDPYYHYHYHYHNHWYAPHYGHNHHHYNPGYHNPAHRPGGPGGTHGGNHKPVVQHRPSYGTTAGSSTRPGGGRLSYSDRLGGSSLGGTRTNDRGAVQITGPATGGGVSSTRPGTTITAGRPGGTPNTTIQSDRNGNRSASELLNQDLKSSLSSTTLRGTSISRGNATTGTSNSTSRGNATSGSSSSTSRGNAKLTTTGSSSSSSSATTRKGTTIRVGGNRSTTSTTRSKSTVKSSSSSVKKSSSSSSSSSSKSSSSSSFRSSSSSSSRSSSSSFSSGSSTRSSGSGFSSSSSRGSSRR